MNTLIVNVILFSQTVLNVFYVVGMCASNELLAHAHTEESILSFILLLIKASFYNLLHVYLYIIPKRQSKGKRQKNKECKYFAQTHSEGCVCCLECHVELAVLSSSLSWTILTRLLGPLVIHVQGETVVLPGVQSFRSDGGS